jgi:hypothetical protein
LARGGSCSVDQRRSSVDHFYCDRVKFDFVFRTCHATLGATSYKVPNYLPLKSLFGQVPLPGTNELNVSRKPSFFRIFHRFFYIFHFKIKIYYAQLWRSEPAAAISANTPPECLGSFASSHNHGYKQAMVARTLIVNKLNEFILHLGSLIHHPETAVSV